MPNTRPVVIVTVSYPSVIKMHELLAKGTWNKHDSFTENGFKTYWLFQNNRKRPDRDLNHNTI